MVEKTISEITMPWKDGGKEAPATEIPEIVVFNKVDAFSFTEKEEDDLTPMTRENFSLDDLKKTWMARLGDNCVFISARQKENIEELRQILYERVKQIHIQRYPYNDFLFQKYE